MVSVVQKPFESPGGHELPTGTIVDTSTWRNEQRLHNCRFLRPATESEVIALREGRTLEPPTPAKATATGLTGAKARTPRSRKTH